MLGCCPNCTEDYDTSHHPNNLDCKNYCAVVFVNLEIKDELSRGADEGS